MDNPSTPKHHRIGLVKGDRYLADSSQIVLSWPYKDSILEGGQTKEEIKQGAIYLNPVLVQNEFNHLFAPKVLTHFVRYTAAGIKTVTGFKRDTNGVIAENLIIKGNNLFVLHTLKTQFRGQVKLIYIDPPYNLGNHDLGYTDHLTHAAWLTFMKNRLEAARELMRTDGVIFIHIGDQEMHYLKVLADEIFGRENFIATIPRKTRTGKSDVPYRFSQDFDWLLMYTKGASKIDALFHRTVARQYYHSVDFPNDEWRLADLTTQRTIRERPNSDFSLVNPRNGQEFPVNPRRSWCITKDSVSEYLQRKKIVFPGDYDFLDLERPAMRVFKSEEKARKGNDYDQTYVSSDFFNRATDELLKNTVNNKKGTDEIVALFGGKVFSYPKNELLIKLIIEYTTRENDIVLDFHLGSGTTAAVAHKMKRQYIGIEQMDYIESIPVERLKKVIAGEQGGISHSVHWQGGGEFIYCELMKYNAAYKDCIQVASSSKVLLLLWQEIAEGSFLNWRLKPDSPQNAIQDFETLGKTVGGLEKQKIMLADLLDENLLYVALSAINNPRLIVSESEKILNKEFYHT